MVEDNDVDSGGGGLGGWAWYQLGRWSAELDQVHAETHRRLFGPRKVTVLEQDWNDLVTDRVQLEQDLNHLQQRFDKAAADNRSWQEWAAKMRAEKTRLAQEVAELTQKLAGLQNEYDVDKAFLQDTIDDLWQQIQDLKAQVEKLQKRKK